MYKYWLLYNDEESKGAWIGELYPSLKELPEDINHEHFILANLSKIRDRIKSEIKPEDEGEFSISRAMEILDINRYTIHDWLQRGFLEPLGKERQGRGKKILFSREDLYRMALFKIASNRGLGRSAAMVLIKHFKIKKTVLAQ
jgi:hypothetical protein